MAMDFISEADSRFFADNLLSSEDWDDGTLCNIEDLPDISDFGSADDLLQRIPDIEFDDLLGGRSDLLDGRSDLKLSDGFNDPWTDLDMNLDQNGYQDVQVKTEPLSPAPSSCSDSSGEGFSNQKYFDHPQLSPQNGAVEVKLETPPLTPSSQNPSPPPPTSPYQCKPIVPKPLGVPIITAQPTGTQTQTQPSLQETLQNLKAQAPGQPIVLTQAEFARLAAQGLIKPTNQQPVATTTTQQPAVPLTNQQPAPAPVQVPPAKPIAPAVSNPSLANGNVDIKVLKRQQRMIKNRESACLSRKKKKEYLQGLEDKLKALGQQNEKLRQENNLLKKRVQFLNNENERLRSSKSLFGNKQTTVAMAILFLVCFNLAPLATYSLFRRTSEPELGDIPIRHARTLLQFSEDGNMYSQDPDQTNDFRYSDPPADVVPGNESKPGQERSSSLSDKALMILPEFPKPSGRKPGMEERVLPSCPLFNTTDSIRLADELTGWLAGLHKQEFKEKQQTKKKTQPKKKPAVHRSPKRYKNTDLALAPTGEGEVYEVQVFGGPDRSYLEFLEAINRREDTFYVVSFRKDHLLLPATAHNKTMRPRMSLLMPAVNETVMDTRQGHMAMMQIDCEVMNTQMIQLKTSNIPAYLRDNATYTVPSPNMDPKTVHEHPHPEGTIPPN
ncbi:cyclic AMP-dependent transcription factor ATF-6 alpha-like [Branchiostoma floridae x Branchiostoma belcheri]